MIHNTFLIQEKPFKILANTQYWPVTVEKEKLLEFVKTRAELRASEADIKEIPLIIDDYKFHGWSCGDNLLLVFVTDTREDEQDIFEKIENASKIIKKNIEKDGLEKTIQEYSILIEPTVISRLKIALVGEGGVGKTTTLHLLLGDTPPTQYVPTIALNLETVENIRFGNYSLVLWDFAGQERFRNLWRFYFHGADVIFLVCDSTLRNVLISKDILKLIRRDAPKVPVFALANKQDLPNALKPEIVQKILGVPTYPMVAIDKERRDEMLRILMNAAAQYVGVVLPDLPPSELLRFSNEATKEAVRAIEARAKGEVILEDDEAEIEIDDLETIEIVEELLVDEKGHLVEEGEEFEIVEEVVEMVDEEESAAAEAASSTSRETDGNGRKLAESIISEQLDADEVLAEEIAQTPDELLNSALEALSSAEAETFPNEAPSLDVADDEKADLQKILGYLDDDSSKGKRDEDTVDATPVDQAAIEAFKKAIDPKKENME